MTCDGSHLKMVAFRDVVLWGFQGHETTHQSFEGQNGTPYTDAGEYLMNASV